MSLDIDQHIRGWLASLGYALAGKPDAEVQTIFRHEAAQWGLPPQELAEIVRETHRLPEHQEKRPTYGDITDKPGKAPAGAGEDLRPARRLRDGPPQPVVRPEGGRGTACGEQGPAGLG